MSVPSLPRPALGAVRLRFPRRPALFWLAAIVLAVLTGLTVARLISSASAEAARWGDLRPTLVSTTDLEPGSIIRSGDVRVERRPATLVPAGALVGSAEGQVVSAAIHEGEAVLAARLVPAGLSATTAALPEGRFGIAVPTGVGALALERGDVVDVLATFDPDTVGDGEPTFPVARSTTVVGVAEEAVTLAVTEEEAPRVAFALTAGVVTLVLSAAR